MPNSVEFRTAHDVDMLCILIEVLANTYGVKNGKQARARQCGERK
jgi:hypothetical protein